MSSKGAGGGTAGGGFTVIPGNPNAGGAGSGASNAGFEGVGRPSAASDAANRQQAVQMLQDMMVCCLIGLSAREEQASDGSAVLRASRSYDAGSLERLQEKGLIAFRKGSSMLTLTELGDTLGGAFLQIVGDTFANSEGGFDTDVETFRFSLELQLDGRVCTRIIRVPKNLYFDELHVVLQCAFGWGDYHMYDFQLTSGGEKLFVSQKGRGAIDSMFSCTPRGRVFQESTELRLDDVFPRTRTAVYSYDYGDGWQVKLRYLGSDVYPMDEAFACEGGEGDAPPEDVGGIWGFEDFLNVMADPKNPEHKEMAKWAKEQGFRHFDAKVVTEDILAEFFEY